MNCLWGFTWHSRLFYHSWFFWLLLILAVMICLILVFNRQRKNRQMRCPGCNSPVLEVYLRCPDCGLGLKSHCPACSRIVKHSWQYCPHCSEALHSELSVTKVK